jgi:hypothetical protein
MTHEAPKTEELTAKQRLAVSRQALIVRLDEPVWASLIRGLIRRSVDKLERNKLQPPSPPVTSQSDQGADGRTLF